MGLKHYPKRSKDSFYKPANAIVRWRLFLLAGDHQRWFESRGLTELTSSLCGRWSTDLFVIDHVALKTVLSLISADKSTCIGIMSCI